MAAKEPERLPFQRQPQSQSPTLQINEDDDDDLFLESEESDVALSEDTEDASESENYQTHEYTEMKEQMYQHKLSHLKKQLQQLTAGTHPEWLRRKKKIDSAYRERMRINIVVRELEIDMVEQDFHNEKKTSIREFEEKKLFLQEQIINELEEKQRMIETERHSAELTGDSMEMKFVPTRKLRRRANDPAGLGGFGNGEKRRKPGKATLTLLLKEEEVFEDLKIINKSKALELIKPVNSPARTRSPSPGSSSSPALQGKDARIEDGKLFYEKRWFRRGQNVTVDSKEGPSYEAVISAIGSEAIWVRKVGDNAKVRMYVTQLVKGKFSLKRRAV